MDQSGKLSEAEKKHVIAWLQERWAPTTQACPVCNDMTWLVADHAVMPLIVGPGGVQLGGVSYPQVMLISTKCGYTRYFNSIVMGLKLEEEKPEPPAQEQKKDGA